MYSTYSMRNTSYDTSTEVWKDSTQQYAADTYKDREVHPTLLTTRNTLAYTYIGMCYYSAQFVRTSTNSINSTPVSSDAHSTYKDYNSSHQEW